MADVVRVIHQAKAGSHALLVVGTNALFAYENMAGVQFDTGLLATGDIDLLWDANRKLSLAGLKPGEGLLAVLKKADRTFERLPKAPFRAVNGRGYLVDLIRPAPSPVHKASPSSIAGNQEDLIAAEIENLHWLYAAPPVRAVVVGNNGFPAIFDVPDPRVYAAHKIWLSEQLGRDALKKIRDKQQGLAVLQLVREYLPQYALDAAALRGLPRKLRDRITQDDQSKAVASPPAPVAGL